ncbi:MAG: fatty acid desaturase [Pseudomonadota bacterium]
MNGVVTPLDQAMADGAITRRELKALMRRSDRPGLIHLALWLALILATGSLVWAAPGWWVIPAMFLHGVVMVHNFALTHECSHYTAFRTRWLNTLIGHIAGFLVVVPLKFFRYEHCDHHTFTNQHGKDPELIDLPISPGRYALYLSALPYWWYQYGGVTRRALGRLTAEERRFIPKVELSAVIWESRIYLAGYLTVLALVLAGWTAPLFYWWLPLLLGEPVMRFIRMTEHVGRPQVADLEVNTRTNVVSAPWRFLAWNMNYHAEHHYAASVPFHALHTLHERLRGHLHVEPGGYFAAHREILDAMRARG